MASKRALALLFTFIALAVAISIAGMVLMYVAVGRGPSVPRSAALLLRPGGEMQEVAPNDLVGQLVGRESNTVRGFVDNLRKARQDPRITTVVLMPSALQLPFWGKLQELRDAIADFRTSGKRVVAFLEYGGDREYFVATAADRVYLLPTSTLDLTGVASYEIFLRGALDKVGAAADFIAIGDYKAAPNQLTERGLTPAHREMQESLNRDMYDQLIRGIAEARGKTESEVRALVDRGPFSADDALAAGLVDGLAYEDQLDDREPSLASGGEPLRRIRGSDYERVTPRSVGFRTRSRVAVLYAVGTIVSGRSAFDPINGTLVGSDSLVEQIRRIRDDRSIRAVVLRIDSPGGSSVASDVIWRELMITRDRNRERPLVASMSDLAASGGYYIAMPADVIVAQPGTLTGSIGVYGGKIIVGGTMDKIGVTRETIKSGANADIYSPFTPFSPDQRATLTRSMQAFYDNFVAKAAASRKTSPEQMHAVAQGRVWTGLQAKERGLVDELGGLQRAVAIAKERARIPANEEVELVIYPARRSFYEALTEQFAVQTGSGIWAALGLGDAQSLAAFSAPARLFRRGEPLALMPLVARLP